MTPMTSKQERDRLLDHDADGIREFDNALPRWWLYGFYLTIAFAVVYIAISPLLPRPIVGRAGMIAEYQADLEAAALDAHARPPAVHAAVAALADEASLAKGKAIFEGKDNVCFSCHRDDLGGLVGPNLTDDFWLHGCSMGDVVS